MIIVTLSLSGLLSTAAAGAPATVLDHTQEVRIDWAKRLTSTQTWTVRIDDPAACEAGLIAPPGLDGATDDGALVLEDLLIVPPNTPAGTEFTLSVTATEGAGAHAGVFTTAPAITTLHAALTVEASPRQPLTIWADPHGEPNWVDGRTKSAQMTWTDVKPTEEGRAVWSTWESWEAAEAQLGRLVDTKISSKSELGKAIARDLGSSNLPEIARRVSQQVQIEDGAIGTYQEARSASKVVRSGSATAAERGIVLISLLRAAGYPADPALFQQASALDFPILVPSPAMLQHPLVVTKDKSGHTIYIDPSLDSVAVPAEPASLHGATIWVPGELPSQRLSDAVIAGTVTLNTLAQIGDHGDVKWTTSVSAEGAGLQAIRGLLHTLDDKGRHKAMKRLARIARPHLERFHVTASGTRDPFREFQMTVAGSDDAVFTPYAAGLRGKIVPVLGPAIAAWLPPNIRVREIVEVQAPPTLVLAANTKVQPAYSDAAQVDRELERAGQRLRFVVDAERPYRDASSALDAAATEFLKTEGEVGVELIYLPQATGKVAKVVRAQASGPADAAAREALLWWSANNDKKAEKALKKGLKYASAAEILTSLAPWTPAGDTRAFEALWSEIDEEDATSRLMIAQAADAAGLPELAQQLASQLHTDDINLSTEAGLLQLGAEPTKEQVKALLDASADADEPLRVRVLHRTAQWALTHGEPVSDEAFTDDPRGRSIKLAADPTSLPSRALQEQVASVRAAAPKSPQVARNAAQALAGAGLHREAQVHALAAARLAHTSPSLWSYAAERTLAAGNLAMALEAASEASDLEPEDKALAMKLMELATLAVDTEREMVARERANTGKRSDDWPLTLDERMQTAGPESLLALLQYEDAAVLGSASLLSLRAQLRFDAGLLDEAARDSINLGRLHQDPTGPALAFAATVGRVFGSGAIQLLTNPTEDVSRLIRMEYRLITGSGDPRQDARVLRDQPRAQSVLLTAGDPTKAASQTQGWEPLKSERLRAPTGYRLNPILSAVSGVTAYSQRDQQRAIVIVNGETTVLPPPLAQLYTIATPPVEQTDTYTLLRLTNGYLPLYAARAQRDHHTVYGLGFTPEAAARALSQSPIE